MKSRSDDVYQEIATLPVIPGRDIVPFHAPSAPATIPPDYSSAGHPEVSFAGFIDGVDPRNISPRQAATLGMDLYIAGLLAWDEYSMLSFQPELHPDYNRTIGALIGEKARPNHRRDFIKIWDNRLKFELKYNSDDNHNLGDKRRIEWTRSIAHVLRQVENPTDIDV